MAGKRIAAAATLGVALAAGAGTTVRLTNATESSTVLLAERLRTTGCVRAVLPDHRCSPGAISKTLPKRVICSSEFRTTSVRNVPDSEKADVERAYGMKVRRYGRALEIDHIVSLELGGSNDIANLYPEAGGGRASYHVKDKLENKLHALVCTGKMSLRRAQRGLASDWTALYAEVFGSAP